MVKHTQTTRHSKLPTNCLSVFDHFVELALIGLMCFHLGLEYGVWISIVFLLFFEDNTFL